MNRRVLLGMASALALTAPAFAQTPDGDTLVIAQSIDAPTMDPADIGSRNASNVAGHIFGSLYTRVEGGVAPYFATGYTEAEDGLSTSPTGCSTGISLVEWTAMSISPRSIASSISLVNRPLLPISFSGRSASIMARLSPVVLITTISNASCGRSNASLRRCRVS